MKRAAILLVLVAGCSTAPIADLLDYFRPGQMPAEQAPPHGGVCAPRPAGAPASVPGALPPPCFPPAPGAATPAWPPVGAAPPAQPNLGITGPIPPVELPPAAETPSPPPPVFP